MIFISIGAWEQKWCHIKHKIEFYKTVKKNRNIEQNILTPKGPNYVFWHYRYFGQLTMNEFFFIFLWNFHTTCSRGVALRPNNFNNFWLHGSKVIAWYVVFLWSKVQWPRELPLWKFIRIICFIQIFYFLKFIFKNCKYDENGFFLEKSTSNSVESLILTFLGAWRLIGDALTTWKRKRSQHTSVS